MPAEERQDDEPDQEQDEVGLAEVRAVEAARLDDLADPERDRNPGEHGEDEDVDHRHVPPLATEPREGPVTVDRADPRHHDRREQDEEPPEDQCVHHARHEPLEELALAEHDRRLVLDAVRDVVGAVERPRRPNEA
jgi:hypothetical protein